MTKHYRIVQSTTFYLETGVFNNTYFIFHTNLDDFPDSIKFAHAMHWPIEISVDYNDRLGFNNGIDGICEKSNPSSRCSILFGKYKYTPYFFFSPENNLGMHPKLN